MSTNSHSTRRRFFLQAGAALSAPLAASAAFAAAGGDRVADDSAARLAALEAANAIRTLQQTYARLVNAGAYEQAAQLFSVPASAPIDRRVRKLTADRFGANDVIEVGVGASTATARIECSVETEMEIGPTCTLVEMARLQGEGTLRAVERRVLEGAYVKQAGVWKIARLALHAG
jgi:hypothetical protein